MIFDQNEANYSPTYFKLDKAQLIYLRSFESYQLIALLQE